MACWRLPDVSVTVTRTAGDWKWVSSRVTSFAAERLLNAVETFCHEVF